MADTDCASESASSVCDEERVRRLFQACDANGDGYIDSQDLLAICRELNLEDSLDELMLQLGADSQGRISYEQFLQRRLALRPEIDALKLTNKDNSSEISQGKLDSWEWDSGARDMSPVPKKQIKGLNEDDPEFRERLQQQLDEQAQRYEEQLTELHSVIAELTRKLHQQRSMAIAEEDEISDSCASAHEDSITCPLEVSELEPLEYELSDLDNKIIIPSDSPLELPEPKLSNSHNDSNETSPPYNNNEQIESLKQEIFQLKLKLEEANTKLLQYEKTNELAEEETLTDSKILESPESHIEIDCETKLYSTSDEKNDIKYSNIVPIHRANIKNNSQPITKIAERIKLKRATDDNRDVNPNDLINSDLPTAVAEHIVGDILRQCDAQTEKQAFYMELGRLNAKLEHARSQNSVLAITLSETKAHCDRLAMLCGKYESNAIALRLALSISDRTIEAYDVLLALLETELSLNENDIESVQNRTAAETVAKNLLYHLDSHKNTEIQFSPWQNHVYTSPIVDSYEVWTPEHETRLREHVSRLKAERSNVQGTYVALESIQVENPPIKPSNSQEARKMDLEMAVLLQELMSLREDKAELLTKQFVMEKDKSALELKVKYFEGQQKAQSATLKNLQGQLKDTEALLALATKNKEQGYSDAEHAQGVELELMQALAREARLKVRLQELVTALEQVTRNAEARLLEGREIVRDLNHTNSMLMERNTKKNHYKYKDTEHYMISIMENQQKSTLLENIEEGKNLEILDKKRNYCNGDQLVKNLLVQQKHIDVTTTPKNNSDQNIYSAAV